MQYTIGPVIENGFFYDFELPPGFCADELPKVEKEMQKIIDENCAFAREDVDPARGARGTARGEPAITRMRSSTNWSSGRRENRFDSIGRAIFSTSAAGRIFPPPGRIKAFKLTERRRGVLARRQQSPAAHPHLRHRVLRQKRPRAAPQATRRSQEARPSRHRPAAGAVHHR